MARRRIPRPVKVDPPGARIPFVDSSGLLTPHALKVMSFLRDRTGGDYDSVWAALGIGVTGLTQINLVGQRVDAVEALAASALGAIAGLRGDPRLDDAVAALSIAITALVQVQARASGQTDQRLSETEKILASFGARLTKAQQAIQYQAGEMAASDRDAQQFQTSVLQRLASTQNGTQEAVKSLETDVSSLTTDDVAEATSLYFTNGRARDAVEAFIVPAASIAPTNNGEMVIEATANTTLTLKLKGTDGVVRSIALTLT